MDFVASQDGIATGTARKTVLELAVPASAEIDLFYFWIDFKETTASQPALVEVCRATASITGTTFTPERLDGVTADVTQIVTAKHTATAGSGSNLLGRSLMQKRVSPTSGYELWLPGDHLWKVRPIAGATTYLRLDVTSGTDVLCTPGFLYSAA